MRPLKMIFVFVFALAGGLLQAQSYEDVVATFNEGADNINRGEFQAALDDLNEVLTLGEQVGAEADDLVAKAKEQIPLMNYQIAIAYIKQKDYENAIPYLENTVDLAAQYDNNQEFSQKAMRYLPTLLTGVGTRKMKSADLAEAEKMFEHAVKYAPDYPKAYLGKGLVHQQKFEEDAMIEALAKAIELGQSKGDAETVETAQTALGKYFVDLGKIELEDMEEFDEDYSYAIEAFESAIQYDPDNTDAHYQLSSIYNRMIEYDKAVEHGLKALEKATNELQIAAINFELGNAYSGNVEYEKACEAYTKAMVGVFEERAAAKKRNLPGCE